MTIISQKKITKAIFPVGGLGTRFLPATKSSPKEMLCVVDKPLIQYAVEEAAASGITNMIFVTGRNKRAIEDHFDKAFELESKLIAQNKIALLKIAQSVKPAGVECCYIRQPDALGLGHAVLCAERLINDEPFAVILADDLIESEVPVIKQMILLHAKYGTTILGAERIARDQSRSYGVVAGTEFQPLLHELSGIIEKPAPADAPSDLGVVGRYILTPSIFKHLRLLQAGTGGEIQLTDAIAALMKDERILAYQFKGQRYDCGSKRGYLQATVELALKHPEVRESFSNFLNSLLHNGSLKRTIV